MARIYWHTLVVVCVWQPLVQCWWYWWQMTCHWQVFPNHRDHCLSPLFSSYIVETCHASCYSPAGRSRPGWLYGPRILGTRRADGAACWHVRTSPWAVPLALCPSSYATATGRRRIPPTYRTATTGHHDGPSPANKIRGFLDPLTQILTRETCFVKRRQYSQIFWWMKTWDFSRIYYKSMTFYMDLYCKLQNAI